MKLYRCINERCATSGANFESDSPACPTCRVEAIELVPVHYLVPATDGPIKTGLGNRKLACMPARAKLPKAATGERAAVTCPKCLASQLFKDDERNEVDNHDTYVERKVAIEHKVAIEDFNG